MNAISVTHSVPSRFAAIVITLLLFGVIAYLVSAFVWLLPHAFRHAREMSPDASGFNLAVNALLFAARFVLDTYPGSLMTPAFAVAGLCTTVAGLWLGKPPSASALLPWIAITIAVAGFGLSSGETTLTGLASAWPFYLSDAVIACLCWALARPFW